MKRTHDLQLDCGRLCKLAHHQAHTSLEGGNARAAQADNNIPAATKAQASMISGLILRNGRDSGSGDDAIVPGSAVDMQPNLQNI
jgi:hypothetical protein